jgi:hypothetical protein
MVAVDESAERLSAGFKAVVLVPLQEVNPIETERSETAIANIRFFATVLVLFVIGYFCFGYCFYMLFYLDGI